MGHVVGTSDEGDLLIRQGIELLMPFIQRFGRDQTFFTCPRYFKGKDSFLSNCKKIRTYSLNQDDLKELRTMYPNFTFMELDEWKRINFNPLFDSRREDDLKLFWYTSYRNVSFPAYPFVEFRNSTTKDYDVIMKSGDQIFI